MPPRTTAAGSIPIPRILILIIPQGPCAMDARGRGQIGAPVLDLHSEMNPEPALTLTHSRTIKAITEVD